MPDVRLREETDRTLVFAHRPIAGLIIGLFGAGMAGVAWATADGLLVAWLIAGVGGLLALVGLGAALWRYELTLDLEAGTFRRRKGFWPSPSREEGSLDRLTGVVITREWKRSSSNNSSREYVEWSVALEFEGWDAPVSVLDSRDEERAYGELERLAERLEVDAVDRCGPEERRTPWTELDLALADRLAARGVDVPEGAALPRPPADSGIEVRRDGAGTEIVLPASGMSAGAWLFVLFGLAFGGFGAVPMLSALGLGFSGEVEGPVFVVGPIFILFGLGLAGAILVGARTREIIREEADAIVFATRILGRDRLVKRLAKPEIEDVALRRSADSRAAGGRVRVGSVSIGRRAGDGDAPREIVVRSDRAIVRIGDDLDDPAARDWLHRAVTALVAR